MKLSNNSFQVSLYKLYILTLPFEHFLNFSLGDFFDKIFPEFSTFIMILGLVILQMQGLFKFYARTTLFWRMFWFMAIYSFIASAILSMLVPNGFESPFSCILGDIILYLFVVLAILYNYINLSYFVRFKDLYKVLDIQLIVLLIVGYSQLFAMTIGFGPYDVLTHIFSLRETEWLLRVNRGVTFFGSEPSSAAILCFLTLPYIYTSIVETRGLQRFKYIIAGVLLLFLFISSNSSQVLILFFMASLIYVWKLIFKRIPKLFYIGAFVLGFIFSLLYLNSEELSFTKNNDSSSLEYAVAGKVVDRENMSTAMRASTIINDWKVFFDKPWGVGNGNQGFYYRDNVPNWVLVSPEVQLHIMNHTIVNGGGNFFPAYISAFGILGIFVLFVFCVKYKRLYHSSILMNNERLNIMFQIALILFLFSSWHVVGLKQAGPIIFMLSLPLIKQRCSRL